MAASKPKHEHIHNLGAYAHPPKHKTNPKPRAPRTHLAHPAQPEASKVVKGPAKPTKRETKSKASRAEFALSGGRFPLNTAGRVKVADKDAAIARKAGTITAAQEAEVKRKVAAKRGGKGK